MDLRRTWKGNTMERIIHGDVFITNLGLYALKGTVILLKYPKRKRKMLSDFSSWPIIRLKLSLRMEPFIKYQVIGSWSLGISYEVTHKSQHHSVTYLLRWSHRLCWLLVIWFPMKKSWPASGGYDWDTRYAFPSCIWESYIVFWPRKKKFISSWRMLTVIVAMMS